MLQQPSIQRTAAYSAYPDQMYPQQTPQSNWYGAQQNQPQPPYMGQPPMQQGEREILSIFSTLWKYSSSIVTEIFEKSL